MKQKTRMCFVCLLFTVTVFLSTFSANGKTLDISKYRTKSQTAIVKAINKRKTAKKAAVNRKATFFYAKKASQKDKKMFVSDADYWGKKGSYFENNLDSGIYVRGVKILGQKQSRIQKLLKKKGFKTTGVMRDIANSYYGFVHYQYFFKTKALPPNVTKDEQVNVGYDKNMKAVFFRYYPHGSDGCNM